MPRDANTATLLRASRRSQSQEEYIDPYLSGHLLYDKAASAAAEKGEKELNEAKAKVTEAADGVMIDAKARAGEELDKGKELATQDLDKGKELAAQEYDIAKQQAAAAAEKASSAWDTIMEMLTSVFAGAKSAADDLAAREEASFMVGIAANPEIVPELRTETSNYLLHYVKARTGELKKKFPLPPGEGAVTVSASSMPQLENKPRTGKGEP